jgi:uncharacterized membrane protein YfcA
MDWLTSLSGFIVGVIVGLTGVGGGSLMTPLLVLAFGVAPATAVGTDLLYAAITKAGGMYVHDRQGTIDYRIAGLLGLGSVPLAIVTTIALHLIAPAPGALAALIKATLGSALLLTAAALIFKNKLATLSPVQGWTPRKVSAATVLVGAVLGVLVTISSVGAGAVGVAALIFLYPGRPTVRIVGTDIAHAVPLTLVAGLGHASLGTVDLTLLAALLIGSIPGVMLGSALSRKLPERILRPSLAAMLVLVGAKLVS